MIQLPQSGRVTKRFSFTQGFSAVVDDVPIEEAVWFHCFVTPPASEPPIEVGSPRDNVPWTLLTSGGLFVPQEPMPPGTCIEVVPVTYLFSGEYEIMTGPRLLRHGARVVAHRYQVLPLSVLYPFSASAVDNSGVVISGAMPIAIWSTGESHNDRGTYEDFDAEAPAEYASAITTNTTLFLDGRRYRVTRSRLSTARPRLLMSLRRSNG